MNGQQSWVAGTCTVKGCPETRVNWVYMRVPTQVHANAILEVQVCEKHLGEDGHANFYNPEFVEDCPHCGAVLGIG